MWYWCIHHVSIHSYMEKGLVDAREGEDGVFYFYIHIWREGLVDAREGKDGVFIY